MEQTTEQTALLGGLIERALKAGADAADSVLVSAVSLSVSRRLGEPEGLERSEGTDIGLRVFHGKRQAVVSSSDVSDGALDELAERAVAMARVVPEDPFCGLAEPALLCTDPPDLDASDSTEPSTETLTERAGRAEDAAMAVAGVTNSDGAGASWYQGRIALAASNGFAQSYVSSRSSISVSVLAGEGTGMEGDYDYSSAVYAQDLESPERIGRNAGEQAVRRLGPRKAQTGSVPVIFDPRVSRTIIGSLASAINGASVARGTTFLKDGMGKRLFGETITIVDDPHRMRGLQSRPFDGEGVTTRPMNIIENGVLTTWILDLRSARKLGLQTTGHASRGTSAPPSPSTSNLYLKPGSLTPGGLMADIKSGFYITDMMGFGTNIVTGDYSRGASGFWIENGQLAHPVSEVTVAGNLRDMFANLAAANDLQFRYGTNAPTLRIDGMTLAGQ